MIAARLRLRRDEALVDQAGEDAGLGKHRASLGHGQFERLVGERPGERGKAAEGGLFLIGEQPVAPLDRGPQG